MSKTVQQLLDVKGRKIFTVSPDTTVLDALRLMAKHRIGSVLVQESDGSLCGIMSERDYARKVELQGKTAANTRVSEIMTSRVLVVHPQDPVERCMAQMTSKRLRHLPVVDKDRVVGIISIGDVVRSVIADQEFLLDQLETYIMGHQVQIPDE